MTFIISTVPHTIIMLNLRVKRVYIPWEPAHLCWPASRICCIHLVLVVKPFCFSYRFLGVSITDTVVFKVRYLFTSCFCTTNTLYCCHDEVRYAVAALEQFNSVIIYCILCAAMNVSMMIQWYKSTWCYVQRPSCYSNRKNWKWWVQENMKIFGSGPYKSKNPAS